MGHKPPDNLKTPRIKDVYNRQCILRQKGAAGRGPKKANPAGAARMLKTKGNNPITQTKHRAQRQPPLCFFAARQY